jgi:hypothetical protein
VGELGTDTTVNAGFWSRLSGESLSRSLFTGERFRGGPVFKAHRLLYHSTLGPRVIKKKKRRELDEDEKGTS